MIPTFSSQTPPVRMALLTVVAVLASLVFLAFLPMLLRQSSCRAGQKITVPVALVPLTIEDASLNKPDDAPPELEIVEVPDIDIPEPEPLPPLQIETPITHVAAAKSLVVPAVSDARNTPVQSGIVKTRQKTCYDMDEVDRKPVGARTEQPKYPHRARRMSIEGYVKVRFLVDCSGRPREWSILEAKPEGVFEPAVLKALPKWKFNPAQKDGRNVDTWVKTTIEFKLTG